MAVLEIAQYGEPVLRVRCKSVESVTNETRKLIADMIETMNAAAGVGLAAPQVRVAERLFVYDVGDGPGALINPELVRQEGEVIGVEGCLSIPRLQGDVPRAEKVLVRGLDQHGKKVRIEATEWLARVFQHEMDHLDGVLFIDRADKASLHWLTEEEEDERKQVGRERRRARERQEATQDQQSPEDDG
jgi:peptide deformylase